MNLAYVAGLLDGEGCIGFTTCRNNIVPRVDIANTNEDIIVRLQEQFGGSIRYANRVKSNWKRGYHWVVTSKLAVDFLEKVQPWIIIKKNQILCIYAHAAIRPGLGNEWTADGKEVCELLKNQMHWLNKKGVHNDVEPIQAVLDEIRSKK